MPTTTEISRVLDLLSDYEREHFMKLLSSAAEGERFWESGVATVYNQYVKTRSNSDLASASFDPGAAEGIFAPIPVTKSYPGAANIVLPPAEAADGKPRRPAREPALAAYRGRGSDAAVGAVDFVAAGRRRDRQDGGLWL